MRDIVHIQVGQCGNQISSKVLMHMLLIKTRRCLSLNDTWSKTHYCYMRLTEKKVLNVFFFCLVYVQERLMVRKKKNSRGSGKMFTYFTLSLSRDFNQPSYLIVSNGFHRYDNLRPTLLAKSTA